MTGVHLKAADDMYVGVCVCVCVCVDRILLEQMLADC